MANIRVARGSQNPPVGDQELPAAGPASNHKKVRFQKDLYVKQEINDEGSRYFYLPMGNRCMYIQQELLNAAVAQVLDY